MAAHAAVFCLVTAVFLQKFTSLSLGEETTNMASFTTAKLTERIRNAKEKAPLCVLYRDSRSMTSKMENNFQSFLAASLVKEECFFKGWTFGTVDVSQELLHVHIHPGTVPALLCYTGTSSPSRYTHDTPNPSRKSFAKWLKEVKKNFSTRVNPFASEELENVITSYEGLTVIGTPGHLYHQEQEEIFRQLSKENKGKIQFFIALPFSKDQRSIQEMFLINEYPAVTVIEQQVWLEKNEPSYKLQGPGNVGIERLRVLFAVLHSQVSLLNVADFPGQVLETKHQQAPTVVCFYSPRNPETFNYLDAFQRSVDTFSQAQASLRFGLVNIVDEPTVVSRYVNASAVTAVPFTVLFWQEKKLGTQQFEMKQGVFNGGTPTPLSIYQFLQMNTISVLLPFEDQTDVYTPWAESADYKKMCYWSDDLWCKLGDNATAGFVYDDFPSDRVVFGPELPPPSWSKRKVKRSITTIPFVSDETWASVVEQSVAPRTSYGAPAAKNAEEKAFSVALVVFIKAGCDYCQRVIPTLEQIFKLTKFVGSSMYLMNCTSDPFNCQRQGITGYPTLTAFRSLSWSAAEACLGSHSKSNYLRHDYHGPITKNLVLEWLSNATRPAVDKQFISEAMSYEMPEDARLVGTLYTRSLARRYLHTNLNNKWYPLQCFKLACELLFGRVPCFVVFTRDVANDGSKDRAKDHELVLSKLELQRSDGVRVKVFQLGQAMEHSMNDGKDTRLHMLHGTHRYNLPPLFKCENDHALCTDAIVRFSRDHYRLPITHITTAAFHARRGPEFEASEEVFTRDLPVLLALVHKSNVTKGSQFHKELTEAAYAMYNDVMFVTIDVDEFPFWTSQFVPKGYHAKYAYVSDDTPSLYHYPRLCIVHWNDHQHAAFYPPVRDLEGLGARVQDRLDRISAQEVIQFARDYLKNPKELIIRTDLF